MPAYDQIIGPRRQDPMGVGNPAQQQMQARSGKSPAWLMNLAVPNSRQTGLYDKTAHDKMWRPNITTDPQGNVIVSGQHGWTDDLVIMKFDQFGKLLWSKHLFHQAATGIYVDVITDRAGNIYLAGKVAGTFSWCMKMGPGGNILWAKRFNSTNNARCSVCIDALGYLWFLTTFATGGVHLIKFDASGNVLQCLKLSLTAHYSMGPRGLAADNVGNIYAVSFETGVGNAHITSVYAPTGVRNWGYYHNIQGAAGSVAVSKDGKTVYLMSAVLSILTNVWTTLDGTSAQFLIDSSLVDPIDHSLNFMLPYLATTGAIGKLYPRESNITRAHRFYSGSSEVSYGGSNSNISYVLDGKGYALSLVTTPSGHGLLRFPVYDPKSGFWPVPARWQHMPETPLTPRTGAGGAPYMDDRLSHRALGSLDPGVFQVSASYYVTSLVGSTSSVATDGETSLLNNYQLFDHPYLINQPEVYPL